MTWIDSSIHVLAATEQSMSVYVTFCLAIGEGSYFPVFVHRCPYVVDKYTFRQRHVIGCNECSTNLVAAKSCWSRRIEAWRRIVDFAISISTWIGYAGLQVDQWTSCAKAGITSRKCLNTYVCGLQLTLLHFRIWQCGGKRYRRVGNDRSNDRDLHGCEYAVCF